MESIRDIRARIKSINNTKQITESMRLISTSKVQKTRKRMEDNRPYLNESVKMLRVMAKSAGLARNKYIVKHEVKKSLIILITSDRGLCGGYNVNAEREAYTLMQRLGEAQFIAIGIKGRDYLRRRRRTIVQVFKGLSENPLYEDAQNIGAIALEMYDKGEIEQAFLVYTEYHTMLVQTPRILRLLPLETDGDTSAGSDFNCESGEELLFDSVVKTYVASVIFGAMLESAVCEQCARITGMDSASKNSAKIVDALTLQYNQIRQSAITQEIAEIVGGANSVSHAEK